ncbi:MAG: ABC transporter permease [Candidatus Dormibacteraeota bacterium]|nr:ABC transporter permease [Candidatus Dormibacteraeota bacterium]
MSGDVQGFALENRPTPPATLIAETWGARWLIMTLARKEFFVRYRRASFGLLWAVGLPLFQAAVLTVVFSRVLRINAGVPYPAFVYAGLIGWSFFSAVLGGGSSAIVDNAMLASRIYFPRTVLPLVTVVANLYSHVISAVILVIICLAFGVPVGVHLALLIPATLLMTALSASFVLVLSALHVYFRDVRFIVQAALIAWFYVTPVFYPTWLLSGRPLQLILLNPVTGVVELFRAATVGADADLGYVVAVSCVWTVVLGAIGLLLHARFNRVFSDLL